MKFKKKLNLIGMVGKLCYKIINITETKNSLEKIIYQLHQLPQ